MAPYIGQIKLFAFNFVPVGWLPCDGRQLPIANYEPLFTYIGHAYGNRHPTNFNLPDLRSGVPIHRGRGSGLANTYVLGRTAGAVSFTMRQENLPRHSHTTITPVNVLPPCSTAAANTPSPVNAFPTSTPGVNSYASLMTGNSCATALNPSNVTVSPTGSGEPIPLFQPCIALRWCICFQGIFPSN